MRAYTMSYFTNESVAHNARKAKAHPLGVLHHPRIRSSADGKMLCYTHHLIKLVVK